MNQKEIVFNFVCAHKEYELILFLLEKLPAEITGSRYYNAHYYDSDLDIYTETWGTNAEDIAQICSCIKQSDYSNAVSSVTEVKSYHGVDNIGNCRTLLRIELASGSYVHVQCVLDMNMKDRYCKAVQTLFDRYLRDTNDNERLCYNNAKYEVNNLPCV